MKRRPKAQYKSVIYFSSEEQRVAALASVAAKEEALREERKRESEGQGKGGDGDAKVDVEAEAVTVTEVVTEVLPMGPWHDAEERHQGYVLKHRAAKARRAADAQGWVDAWGTTSSTTSGGADK